MDCYKSEEVDIYILYIFCGRQNLALRSHNDSRLINLQNSYIYNDSNFRVLLRFKYEAGNTNLANHLKTAPQNTTYLNLKIPNKILKLCSCMIIEQFVFRISESR